MDTKTLITEAKARFSHNAAKAYLRDKYFSKLIVAEQGGLWKADAATIGFLNAFNTDTLIVMDTFDNPVQVNRLELLNKLTEVYDQVMTTWYTEWKQIEGKR